MKLKFIIAFCLMALFNFAFAATQHAHSQKDSSVVKKTVKSISWPGSCGIEIINRSYEPVQVYGQFDDGEGLSFSILPYDPSHFISLYYYGYCHYDMYINITTFNGYPVFSGYPRVGSTIEIVSMFNKQLSVKLGSK